MWDAYDSTGSTRTSNNRDFMSNCVMLVLQGMHSFATSSSKGIHHAWEAVRLMHQRAKICVLLLPRNLATAIQQPETPWDMGTRTPKNYDAGFVRGQIDFHIENSTGDVKHVQQLLHLGWVGTDQRDVVRVQNVPYPQTTQDRTRSGELHLVHVMQQLNEQIKQQSTELTTLFGASSSVQWVPKGAVHRHTTTHSVKQRHKQGQELAMNAKLPTPLQQ
jgi:hypothetical protein